MIFFSSKSFENKIIFFKPSGASQASTSKVSKSPTSPDGFSGWTEEETSVAALNASLTSASIRCSRSLLNEGFWEDDDWLDDVIES